MKSMVFWVVTLCSSAQAHHFGGKYHLHLQRQRVSQARNQFAASAAFLLGQLINPEDGRDNIIL
jgi:hypothetical protein